MNEPITDASLSIVREMLSSGGKTIILPKLVVRQMVARIDKQDKKIARFGVLVACHDNCLIEVNNAAGNLGVTERLRRLEKARERVEELERLGPDEQPGE